MSEFDMMIGEFKEFKAWITKFETDEHRDIKDQLKGLHKKVDILMIERAQNQGKKTVIFSMFSFLLSIGAIIASMTN